MSRSGEVLLMSRPTWGYDNIAKHSATGALVLKGVESLTSHMTIQDKSY